MLIAWILLYHLITSMNVNTTQSLSRMCLILCCSVNMQAGRSCTYFLPSNASIVLWTMMNNSIFMWTPFMSLQRGCRQRQPGSWGKKKEIAGKGVRRVHWKWMISWIHSKPMISLWACAPIYHKHVLIWSQMPRASGKTCTQKDSYSMIRSSIFARCKHSINPRRPDCRGVNKLLERYRRMLPTGSISFHISELHSFTAKILVREILLVIKFLVMGTIDFACHKFLYSCM